MPKWFKFISDKVFTNDIQEIVLPWGIYITDELEHVPDWLLQHAFTHVDQINRDGMIKFYVKYIWYWGTLGYWMNPYEVEARDAENRPEYHKQLEPFYQSTKRSWSKWFE